MAIPWRQAIIVGASSGMGAELARLLAAEGCRVALVARREAELAQLAEEINRQLPNLPSPFPTSPAARAGKGESASRADSIEQNFASAENLRAEEAPLSQAPPSLAE